MKQFKRFAGITFAVVAMSISSFAQEKKDGDGSPNLVENPGFETTKSKTLKEFGGLDEFCDKWFSATKAPADVFARGVKSGKVNIPDNAFGSQEPSGGDFYAGFRAYTKDKKLKRTYLSSQLLTQLEKDQMYCVKFNVSLGELSKFAVNNIGMVFTDKRNVQPNEGEMVKELSVVNPGNPAISNMEGWVTVCGTYIAKGSETHLIIGCFDRDDKLKIEKPKRPKGVTGTQVYEAYYFVDDVEVVRVQAKSQCACNETKREPDVIYSRSTPITEDMSPSDKIKASAVYYAYLKGDLNAMAKRDLDNVAKLMKENPNIRLEVVGHTDNDEATEAQVNDRYANLAKQRADAVVEYLKSQGVSELRMVPRSKDNTEPANTRPTPLSVAQNRRVEFIIK
jgi:outer membrane protein OmpA-like peptidoglycan-associated protein